MVDAGDYSVGILIDLDIAVRIKDGDTPLSFKPVHAGTLPFRSIHILDQGDPVSELFYRDDLESFFYTLVWILTYHTFPFATGGPSLVDWCRHDLAANVAQKTGFLLGGLRELPTNALRTTWLLKLATMFRDGYYSLRDNNVLDHGTIDGQITFETFVNILES